MTQQEECLTTATRNGWTTTTHNQHTRFTKGPRTLDIQFSDRGTIITATTPRRHIAGTRKLDRILIELGG